MLALEGSTMIYTVPMSHFQTRMVNEKMGLTDCATAAAKFSYGEMVAAGGFAQVIRAGQGVVIPPGWVISQIGPGLLPDPVKPKDSTDGCAIFAALIEFGA